MDLVLACAVAIRVACADRLREYAVTSPTIAVKACCITHSHASTVRGQKVIDCLFNHIPCFQYPKQQCSSGMNIPIGITIRPKKFRLGILVWRSFITVHSLHMLSHHHEPFQIY